MLYESVSITPLIYLLNVLNVGYQVNSFLDPGIRVRNQSSKTSSRLKMAGVTRTLARLLIIVSNVPRMQFHNLLSLCLT